MLTLKTIKKLQLEQQKLDEVIIRNNNITDIKERSGFVRSKIALLVEIGEFANELKTFKHWKKDKTINFPKAQEELIDCLHFYLSWVNAFQIDFSDYKFEKLATESDYNELLLAFFSETEKFSVEVPRKIYGPKIITQTEKIWEERINELNPEDKDYQKVVEIYKSQVTQIEAMFKKSNSFSEGVDEMKKKQRFFRWLIIFEELAQKLGMSEKDIENVYMTKNEINRERQKKNY
ncbi:MAG: hypothetical protein GBAus27B_000338 [Mycoplasmataceae bacterium]|nr:MAG: hypothetical protein GBAus27B_000338 [Mycoplasmataceae bacterium]